MLQRRTPTVAFSRATPRHPSTGVLSHERDTGFRKTSPDRHSPEMADSLPGRSGSRKRRREQRTVCRGQYRTRASVNGATGNWRKRCRRRPIHRETSPGVPAWTSAGMASRRLSAARSPLSASQMSRPRMFSAVQPRVRGAPPLRPQARTRRFVQVKCGWRDHRRPARFRASSR